MQNGKMAWSSLATVDQIHPRVEMMQQAWFGGKWNAIDENQSSNMRFEAAQTMPATCDLNIFGGRQKTSACPELMEQTLDSGFPTQLGDSRSINVEFGMNQMSSNTALAGMASGNQATKMGAASCGVNPVHDRMSPGLRVGVMRGTCAGNVVSPVGGLDVTGGFRRTSACYELMQATLADSDFNVVSRQNANARSEMMHDLSGSTYSDGSGDTPFGLDKMQKNSSRFFYGVAGQGHRASTCFDKPQESWAGNYSNIVGEHLDANMHVDRTQTRSPTRVVNFAAERQMDTSFQRMHTNRSDRVPNAFDGSQRTTAYFDMAQNNPIMGMVTGAASIVGAHQPHHPNVGMTQTSSANGADGQTRTLRCRVGRLFPRARRRMRSMIEQAANQPQASTHRDTSAPLSETNTAPTTATTTASFAAKDGGRESEHVVGPYRPHVGRGPGSPTTAASTGRAAGAPGKLAMKSDVPGLDRECLIEHLGRQMDLQPSVGSMTIDGRCSTLNDGQGVFKIADAERSGRPAKGRIFGPAEHSSKGNHLGVHVVRFRF